MRHSRCRAAAIWLALLAQAGGSGIASARASGHDFDSSLQSILEKMRRGTGSQRMRGRTQETKPPVLGATPGMASSNAPAPLVQETLTPNEQNVLMAFAAELLRTSPRGKVFRLINDKESRFFQVFSRDGKDGQRLVGRVILGYIWFYNDSGSFNTEITLYPDGRIDPQFSAFSTETGEAKTPIRNPQNQKRLRESIEFWMSTIAARGRELLLVR